MARLIQVIEAEERRGTGVDRDPYRMVQQIFSVDGSLLMERDRWKAEEDAAYTRACYTAVDALEQELKRPEGPRLDELLLGVDEALAALCGRLPPRTT